MATDLPTPPTGDDVDVGAWDQFARLVVEGGGAGDQPGRPETHRRAATADPRDLRDIEYVCGLVRHHERTIVPFLMGHCRLRGARVIEFGAGTAGLAVAMARAGAASVAAVEPIAINCQAGEARVAAYRLADRVRVHHVPDTTRLPFAGGEFDACVCSSVLQYVPHRAARAAALREMWRVVRPGGLIVVCHSGNGLFPGGPHSTAWWSNLAPDRAARLGHSRGVSYYEVAATLRPLGCRLLRSSDRRRDSELARWRWRIAAGSRLHPRRHLVHGTLLAAYSVLEGLTAGTLGLPVSVFMPYLNVAFVKGPTGDATPFQILAYECHRRHPSPPHKNSPLIPPPNE